MQQSNQNKTGNVRVK